MSSNLVPPEVVSLLACRLSIVHNPNNCGCARNVGVSIGGHGHYVPKRKFNVEQEKGNQIQATLNGREQNEIRSLVIMSETSAHAKPYCSNPMDAE
jgi:hypothetical protein